MKFEKKLNFLSYLSYYRAMTTQQLAHIRKILIATMFATIVWLYWNQFTPYHDAPAIAVFAGVPGMLLLFHYRVPYAPIVMYFGALEAFWLEPLIVPRLLPNAWYYFRIWDVVASWVAFWLLMVVLAITSYAVLNIWKGSVQAKFLALALMVVSTILLI